MSWAMEMTFKEELQTAKSIKENTGMLMSIARMKLRKLIGMEVHNQYASETNAEYGYLGYSVVSYYNTENLRRELFPPQKREVVREPICSCKDVCEDCLPF